MHEGFRLGQFGAGVDPAGLPGRQFGDPAQEPLGTGDRDDVGQIEFALGVVVADFLDEIEQTARIDRHDAAIAQLDFALVGGRVARLDDAREPAIRVERETPVEAGIGRLEAGGGDRRLRGAAPLGEQRRNRFGAQHRRVAEQHHDIGDIAFLQPARER